MALQRRSQREEDDRDLYPADDGVPVEDFKHALNAHQLHDSLVAWLKPQGREVWAPTDNFIYFERNNPSGNVGPDFYVILDVAEDPERDCWRVWNEGGRMPDVVVEFVSKKSYRKDRVKSFAIYQDRLRVPNYFICNNRRWKLEGFELRDGAFKELEPDAAGRMWCAAVGLWIGRHEGWLRWFDREGNVLLTDRERAEEEARRAEGETRRAEAETRRAEREAAARRAAEAEVARLRAEIERLKGGGG